MARNTPDFVTWLREQGITSWYTARQPRRRGAWAQRTYMSPTRYAALQALYEATFGHHPWRDMTT